MGKFSADFKEFIAKGNVVDMAVGVVIGGAFNKIVSSLVNDVIMPLVSLLVGGLNVTDWKWVIREAVYAADGSVVTAETALCYGSFIQSVIDFLIIALTIFTVLRVFAKLQRKRKEEPQKRQNKMRKALQNHGSAGLFIFPISASARRCRGRRAPRQAMRWRHTAWRRSFCRTRRRCRPASQCHSPPRPACSDRKSRSPPPAP